MRGPSQQHSTLHGIYWIRSRKRGRNLKAPASSTTPYTVNIFIGQGEYGKIKMRKREIWTKKKRRGLRT